MCGGRRTEDDVRDQRCCLDCRTGKGTLGVLAAQFRTGSLELNSSRDWPAIKHFACKLFSLGTFDANALNRLEDWLQAKYHKNREQMRAMQTSEVAAILRLACEPKPASESNAPVADRVDEAFGIPTDVEDRPLVDGAGDSFTTSPGQGQTEEASAFNLSSPPPGEPQEKEERQEPQPFCGGAMVFFRDRVEFCGVDICSGSRSQTRRRILDSLRKKRSDGRFVGYSSKRLAEHVGLKGGEGAAPGAIRDLRKVIVELLRNQASLKCERHDVILSGGPGYRFADCVSVRDGDLPETTPITDMDSESNVPGVRNGDVPSVPDDAAGARRVWILQRLADGGQLKAPDVATPFKCSVKTAKRDLKSLKHEGVIEFSGARRTGCYRLRTPPDQTP